MNALRKLHSLLLKAETLLLVFLLISLIVIAVTQVLLRNVFGGGLLWADAYTRISMLWIALIGAMIASRSCHHIAIDVLIRGLPEQWQRITQRISDGLTAMICFVAAWFSTAFVIQERAYGDIAFGNIPSWECEAIIPFAFGVIALRYSAAVFLPENHSG